MTRALGLLVLLLAGACSRSGETAPASRETSADGAATTPGASAGAAAAASATPDAAPSKPAAWSGTYKSAAGTLYIPPQWKGVHWSGAETQSGIGEGTLELEIDPSTGRVVGTLEGPLGPAVIDGLATADKLTATIARKNPSDHGFAGSLMGDIGAGAVTGTMNLSSAEASAVRTATFSLAPAKH